MNTPDSLPFETDVLIVGAGPTGLALANQLSRLGVVPTIVDRLSTGQNTSRAAVIHAHTLEMLEQIGVTQELSRLGLRLTKFSFRDRDRVLARLHFDSLQTPFAHLLMLPQDRTEKVLRDRLTERGVAVRWNHEVTEIRPGSSGVVVRMQAGNESATLRARFVVGADGMHSVVRETAGIGFTGGSYEESFVLADVEADWSLGSDEVMLFFSPDGLVVVAPLPGRRYRIVATLDDAPEALDARDIEALLAARGPGNDTLRISSVVWSSRFRLHHRVADTYRRDRLLLMGDAAHVHSPAGGQGMNTGLVDACVLGKLLADVIVSGRDEASLDSYTSMRRPAALEVLRLADRLTRMATMKHAPQRAIRNILLTAMGHVPAFRDKLKMNLSGLSRRRAAEFAVGTPGSGA